MFPKKLFQLDSTKLCFVPYTNLLPTNITCRYVTLSLSLCMSYSDRRRNVLQCSRCDQTMSIATVRVLHRVHCVYTVVTERVPIIQLHPENTVVPLFVSYYAFPRGVISSSSSSSSSGHVIHKHTTSALAAAEKFSYLRETQAGKMKIVMLYTRVGYRPCKYITRGLQLAMCLQYRGTNAVQ